MKKKCRIIILLMLMMGSFVYANDNEFTLSDANGNLIKLSNFKGKVVILDFWFTGCINCMKLYQGTLSKTEKYFLQNSNVVFVSICIDRDKNKWLNSLEKGKYTSKGSVNLYTDGLGDQHEVIKQYNVSSYPQPIVIGKKGEVLSRADSLSVGDSLIRTIEQALH